MDLTNAEIRVLGCLLEKQRTTPDHYPLSLNSLRLACNQATNRDPVVDYDDAIIRDALHRLERRGYTRLAGRSRAAKYRHLLSQALPMADGEQAVMCVLMLRGAQTPGELKQRGERIHAFESLDEVHATLTALIERGIVARLERRPGQKEERYMQLLGGSDPEPDSHAPASSRLVQAAVQPVAETSSTPDLSERVARLELEVAELRRALGGRQGGQATPSASAGEPTKDALISEDEPTPSASAGEPTNDALTSEDEPTPHDPSPQEAPSVERDWSEQIAQPSQ